MKYTIQPYKWWGLTVIVLLSAVLLAGCVSEEEPEATKNHKNFFTKTALRVN